MYIVPYKGTAKFSNLFMKRLRCVVILLFLIKPKYNTAFPGVLYGGKL